MTTVVDTQRGRTDLTAPSARATKAGTELALRALHLAKDSVEPALLEAVSRLSPGLQDAARHHLSGGGKYLRAALVLLGARACGADAAAAIEGAVAIELTHNFSLVHDDIIDGDLERRHRPTVWAEYGVGHAIIVGDALSTLGLQLLLDDPSPARVRAAAALVEATQQMISGQAEDMAAETKKTLTVDECVHMAAGKTAALLACSCSLGAILADGPDETVKALSRFGWNLGIAFQAVDDVLGIWGEPAVTGKPAGNDLRQHKKTLPVALAAEMSDLSPRLTKLLGGELTDPEVAEASDLLERCGARAEAMAVGALHLEAALAALDGAELSPGPREELVSIATFVASRDR